MTFRAQVQRGGIMCLPAIQTNFVVVDNNGRDVFVTHGLEVNGCIQWGSFRRKKSGALERVKTKFLPMRERKDDALTDLGIYAQTKKWRIKK